MKSNYLILKDRKLILETYSGILTLENSKQHKLELTKDPDYSKEFYVLSDLSRAIFDMPKEMTEILLVEDTSESLLKQNESSLALVHNSNKNVYERIFNRLRSVFPYSHLFSVSLEELLGSIGMIDLSKEVEYSLILLHDNPPYNWD